MYKKFVYKFMKEMEILPISGRVLVAVSGGVDSMVLLDICTSLKEKKFLKEVKALHINHGTRPSNADDELLVQKFCCNKGIECLVERPYIDNFEANFEKRARDVRYEIFFENLLEGDILYTAHNIDDSFEWSLMQKFKTTSIIPTLGIPLIRGRVARPLMSMTKNHIKRYAKEKNVPYIDDPTNKDNSFERNFIRNSIIPNIKKRFPSYLKNYVFSSNQLAKKLGVSKLKEQCNKKLIIYNDEFGGINLIHPENERDFSSYEEEILEQIKKLSISERGTLRQQVKKLIEGSKNSKKGPLTFSGEVLGYIFWGRIYLILKKDLAKMELFDHAMMLELKKNKGAHIPVVPSKPHLRKKNLYNDNFYLQYKKTNHLLGYEIKKSHPLFPKTTNYAIKKGIRLFENGRLVSLLNKLSNH